MANQVLNRGWGIVTAAALLLVSDAALARGIPDYGFEWATITHAGNRPANIDEAPGIFPPRSGRAVLVGSVDHEYRIATTEVTNSQWYDFVVAAAPVYPEFTNHSEFTGFAIRRISNGPGGPEFHLSPGLANSPAKINWYWAARYVNWLNNGKALTRNAFETGAYNIAGLPLDNDGAWATRTQHEPGATFWIPSLDEWDKAVYYDPHRYGQGQEGYWLYPNGGNEPLIADWPENGGQTDVGIPVPTSGDDYFRSLAVRSYPAVRSPWGLYDASGGVMEWLDLDPQFDMPNDVAVVGGGYTYAFEGADRLDSLSAALAQIPRPGLRIASAVPAPDAFLGLLVLAVTTRTHRRRRARCLLPH